MENKNCQNCYYFHNKPAKNDSCDLCVNESIKNRIKYPNWVSIKNKDEEILNEKIIR